MLHLSFLACGRGCLHPRFSMLDKSKGWNGASSHTSSSNQALSQPGTMAAGLCASYSSKSLISFTGNKQSQRCDSRDACSSGCAKVQLGDGYHAAPDSSKPHHLAH